MSDAFPIKFSVASTLSQRIQVHPHWHKEIEILYIFDGQAKQQVGDRFFEVNCGDIIVIGRNQLHSTYSIKGENCKIFVILMDVNDLITPIMSSLEKKLIVDFSSGLRHLTSAVSDAQVLKKISLFIMEIFREIQDGNFAFELIIKARLYELISVVLRNSTQMIDVKTNASDISNDFQLLKSSFNLIDENYAKDISLSDAASASNISIPHFCRVFKHATGMSFKEYLNFYRINIAEKMLLSSDSITSIALECGFGSVASFIRNFKKFKNCTPSICKKENSLNF